MKRALFCLFAVMMFAGLALAQPTGSVPFTATVAQTPLAVTPGAFDASPLVAGQCYKIPADVTNPLAYGLNTNQAISGITVSFTETVIAGDILSWVLVTFAMPPKLTPTAAGPGFVTCTYDNLSAAYGPAGAEANFFNPVTASPMTMQTDATGAINLVLAANLCVDQNATADTYQGDCLVAAQYTGFNP
jgi:hypothetical protein